MLELLMGGSGEVREDASELSEIDEEIMHDVIQIIAEQAEQAWRISGLATTVNRSIRQDSLHRFCPLNERVTVLKFGVLLAGVLGSFNLVFPAGFLNVLMKQADLDQPHNNRLRSLPMAPIRERILDCEMQVSVELPATQSRRSRSSRTSAWVGSQASSSHTNTGRAYRWCTADF